MPQRIAGQSQPLLHRIQNRAPAGMNRPKVDGERIAPARDLRAHILHPALDLARHLAGKMHVKPCIANAPRDQVTRLRQAHGKKTVDRQPARLGANHAGSTPIREKEEGKNLLQFLRLLHVDGAKLQIQHQHARRRF